jgi:cell division protein FtsN
MAREYTKRPKKKGRTRQAGKRRGIAPWTWLLTGLLLGLVVASVAYLKIMVTPPGSEAVPAKQAKKQASPTVAKAPTPPKFDFYTLLPEMEVAVSEPEKAPAPKAKTAPADANIPALPHPLEQASYRLQLASFKRFNDADALKAKLALTGHIVEIHTIKLSNGQVWYRVYTPLIPSRDKALSLQKELQSQAISSMLLRDR